MCKMKQQKEKIYLCDQESYKDVVIEYNVNKAASLATNCIPYLLMKPMDRPNGSV